MDADKFKERMKKQANREKNIIPDRKSVGRERVSYEV